ncbi:Uncharacterised protein [Legionella steigerwaltii]|uniref:Uncharacterized protein n=1 Tax=Legionella steigerwaltii TaxID=460 RepID=A0A378LAA6_9GAMM|nr:hypothetical protein [Legionella steigerwaltii]KTD77542.1 hypothetical protein Lstg_1899 [Legionella steigerwaltii]STY22852.1 Uncharacterised protein [Legionella steigerwaltii]
MKNMQMIHFGLKRFLRYFLIGLICSVTPMQLGGLSIVFPALILFCIILSIDDVSQYKQSVYPPTFPLSYWSICIFALFLDWIIWYFKLV